MLSTRITAIPVGLSDSLERKVISRLDGRLDTKCTSHYTLESYGGCLEFVDTSTH
jgi:hypothetical protein